MKKQTNLSGDPEQPGNPAGPEPQIAEMMQLLVENVRDYAIIFIDPEGGVLTWNAFCHWV